MFAMSFASDVVLRSYLTHDAVIPPYVRKFLLISVLCAAFKWVAALPIIGGLFTFAAFTTYARPRK